MAAAAIDRSRLRDIIDHVHAGLVERDAQARCLVLAVLCGEHALFIGPPGTAKSELARRLHSVAGGLFFERLLTRFTVPEELFGPLSLAALDQGRYERDVQGYLPTATIAFLDEVFKANSAILNALLTLLHEREFDQGAIRLKTPLISVVAASNEVPDDEALLAFYDRFLLRCPVAPVSEAAFVALLASEPCDTPAPPGFTPEQLAVSQAQARAVVVPGGIVSALLVLRAVLADASITVSDRRWVRIVRALRVAAWANQRAEVSLTDLFVLPFMVCERDEQVVVVRDWVAGLLGGRDAVDPQWLGRVVQAFDKQIELEASAAEVAFDDSGKLALMRNLGGADEQAMPGSAPRLSAFSRRRHYSATHLAARLAQIDGVIAEVDDFLARGSAHREAVAGDLAANLWVPPDFARRVLEVMTLNRDRVALLQAQLRRVRAAIDALPRAPTDDGRVPDPMAVDGR